MPSGSDRKALLLFFVLAAGLVILLTGGVAHGALVTIGIIGQVTEDVGDPGNVLGGKIIKGDIFSGTYTYDSGVADSFPSDPTIGEYRFDTPPYGISINMGDLTFASAPQSDNFQIEVIHNGGSMDRYQITSTNNQPLLNGAIVSQIFWRLEYNNSGTFTSDALPLTPPVVNENDLTSNILRIDGAMHIRGEILEAYPIPEVPEPASAILMIIGSTILCVGRRKR
jgi:hypothetical protein